MHPRFDLPAHGLPLPAIRQIAISQPLVSRPKGPGSIFPPAQTQPLPVGIIEPAPFAPRHFGIKFQKTIHPAIFAIISRRSRGAINKKLLPIFCFSSRPRSLKPSKSERAVWYTTAWLR